MSLYTTIARVAAVELDRVWVLVPEWRTLQPVPLPMRDFGRWDRSPEVGEWYAFQWNPCATTPDDLCLCLYRRAPTPAGDDFYTTMLRVTRQTRAACGIRKSGYNREWTHREMPRTEAP